MLAYRPSREPYWKDGCATPTNRRLPRASLEALVADTRRWNFVDSSLVRTHAQSCAEIESPRVRGPHTAGCEFSPATVLRRAALRLKRQRSLVAYGAISATTQHLCIDSHQQVPVPRPGRPLTCHTRSRIAGRTGPAPTTSRWPRSAATGDHHQFTIPCRLRIRDCACVGEKVGRVRSQTPQKPGSEFNSAKVVVT